MFYPPPPNRAIKGPKNIHSLDGQIIQLGSKDRIWKYTNETEVPRSEFWIPQTETRPPNLCVSYNKKFYLRGFEVQFDQKQRHWFHLTESGYPYLEDNKSLGPNWTQGTVEEHVPAQLRSAYNTPRTSERSIVKCLPDKGKARNISFKAPSGSGSELEEGSNTDLSYAEASNLNLAGVPQEELSPLLITPQNETRPPKEPTPPHTPPQSLKGSPVEEDPFEPPIRSLTPPPPPPRSPTQPSSPSDVEMADDTSSSKGERGKMPKAFKGERKKAKSFMIDMNLFF